MDLVEGAATLVPRLVAVAATRAPGNDVTLPRHGGNVPVIVSRAKYPPDAPLKNAVGMMTTSARARR